MGILRHAEGEEHEQNGAGCGSETCGGWGVSYVFGWWFQSIFIYITPILGKWSILTHMFQMGWNHQLVWIWITGWISHWHFRLLASSQFWDEILCQFDNGFWMFGRGRIIHSSSFHVGILRFFSFFGWLDPNPKIPLIRFGEVKSQEQTPGNQVKQDKKNLRKLQHVDMLNVDLMDFKMIIYPPWN